MVETGIDLQSFIYRITAENSTIYFHNLRFDGSFIIDHLLRNGYEHVEGFGASPKGTFKTLISGLGKVFSITVRWRTGFNTEFRDSFKKLPMSVKRVAESFGFDEGKGEIDYDKWREIGYEPTEEEWDYLRRDVSIMAKAMKEVIESGMTRLTVASDALNEYKRLVTKTGFSNIFPVFSDEMDREIRDALRGGFTYADERFSKRITGPGLVLDVNSLYPSVMKNCLIPYGEPQYVSGAVLPTHERPLTIFSVTFTARLKPGHIPCIQIKRSMMFGATEYLKEINEPTTISVTNVDWALYQDHYDIDVVAYGGGWRFRAVTGLFDAYIDKWGQIKAESVGGKREVAKLHLNALFGKFCSNPNITGKIPVMNKDYVEYIRAEDELKEPIYTAAGVFITSHARNLTIRAAQENYDVFAYADTDSLHLLTKEIPKTIDVHKTRMGAWKHEYDFDSAYYIRAKAYLERHPDGEYTNRVAGLPETISETLTFDQLPPSGGTLIINGKFDANAPAGTYFIQTEKKKLNPKTIPGGTILIDTPYKLAV